MFFSRMLSRKLSAVLVFIPLLVLAGCDDLNPSSADLRADVVPGSDGVQVEQKALDFTLSDTLYTDVTLSSEYPSADAVVLYFTMWCPICDSHMSYMRQYVVTNYPNVKFYFVDYVTGSVSASRQAQQSNGYTDFDVLVDTNHAIQELYNATMGTVIVMDSNGIIKMNEDFKDGSKLQTVLALLP
ncbi:MAG: peroxiredoxin family protein [Gammaproteobacteria bacterium]|nr:peroxiredoxin family protein [Gammaproteobacteria bacterium]